MIPEQNETPSIDEDQKLEECAPEAVNVCPLDCPNRAKVLQEKSKAGGLVASAIALSLGIVMVGQVYQIKNGAIETRDNPNVVLVVICLVSAAVFGGVSIPSEVLALVPTRGGR